MTIVFILSIGIILLLYYFFIKKNRHDRYAILGLAFKTAAGISLGLIYKYYYEGGDTFQYFSDSGVIANFLIDQPARIFQVYFHTISIPEIVQHIAYTEQPRALFFSKIVSLFYLLTGGNYWLITIYLSFINLVCTYFLVNELIKHFPRNQYPIRVSFYFLPTLVFWSSGLLKESLAIGALFVLIGYGLKMIRIGKFMNLHIWLLICISALILWELKYFYAAVAVPVLMSLMLYELIIKTRKIPLYYLLLFFVVGISIASTLHYNLSFVHVADVLYQNYQMGLEKTTDGTLRYLDFDGSLIGYLINMPLALAYGLFRPFIFEGSNMLKFLVALENTLVFALVFYGIWKSRLKLTFRSPYVLTSLIYIFCLDILLAYSTPNLGTLSRYKVGFWPFFVLLVLIMVWPKKKSGYR